MEMERGACPSCRRFAAGQRPSGRLALGLVLIVVTAACHGQPSQRPMKAGPVDTGAGSLTAARKYLEGQWSLESYESIRRESRPFN